MGRSFACLLVFLLACRVAWADHITGGEMFYTFVGISGGQYQYKVTAKLFKDCHRNRLFPNPAIISVFDKTSFARIKDVAAPLVRTEKLELSDPGKCITNPPDVCYDVAYYEFDLYLPASVNGYLLATQIVFRVNGIANLADGYSNVGATYTAEIPGTHDVADAAENNSATFKGNEMVVICANNSFNYSFAAEDADGDELRYSFCDAYQGGSFGGASTSSPASVPPYASVPYQGSIFNGSSPLSNAVKLDAKTGQMQGIAPGEGMYVVTVCVDEIRGGKVIARQRKDLQINIASCTIASASLQPEYNLCNDSKTITLSNQSSSPLIQTYYWELFDQADMSVYTSSEPNPVYTFSDTGLYKIKLVINRNQDCSDSMYSLARVYPGLKADFNVEGICYKKPSNFKDATTTVYGQVNNWSWDFGDVQTTVDVSGLQNPGYAYTEMGAKNVRLIVYNTNGCTDTITKSISILDKPPVNLAFRDTTICKNDEVKLSANSSGVFTWSPQLHIIRQEAGMPVVAPPATTTYYVDLDDGGCLNRDSVKVNVVDKINVQAMADTTICKGDSIQLKINSEGYTHSWTPAGQLNDPALKEPFAVTDTTTVYTVTAHLGGCSATDQILVKIVPYPMADAGKDTTICFAASVQLAGSTDGSKTVWLPNAELSEVNILNPMVQPRTTTAFVLAAFDTKGCPKPGLDTVVVTVLPDIMASAGRDTSVVAGQSLQLQATGGSSYSWSPASGLSATDISNPVAVFNLPSERLQYKVVVTNDAGCLDSAYISIKVFQSGPEIYVPNAFTPNDDGLNDNLRPIVVGMQRINQFIVYNRWGQVVFSSSNSEEGWDGTIRGKKQASGVYAWMVEAIDFNGKTYLRKGTVVLIR